MLVFEAGGHITASLVACFVASNVSRIQGSRIARCFGSWLLVVLASLAGSKEAEGKASPAVELEVKAPATVTRFDPVVTPHIALPGATRFEVS